MTPQEVFDKVVSHLREQKICCKNEEGTCAYRNDQGLKCAAGCLINDDEYYSAYEGMSILEILSGNYTFVPKSLIERLYPHHILIYRLQKCHDSFLPQFWESELQSIAQEFNLIKS